MIDLSKAAEKFSIKPDGESLMKMWALAEKMPGGTALFSKLVGRMAPYSGSIGARVADLAPGRARLELEDHKAVRNHLDSVHAIALANLAEMASGLAMLAGPARRHARHPHPHRGRLHQKSPRHPHRRRRS